MPRRRLPAKVDPWMELASSALCAMRRTLRCPRNTRRRRSIGRCSNGTIPMPIKTNLTLRFCLLFGRLLMLPRIGQVIGSSLWAPLHSLYPAVARRVARREEQLEILATNKKYDLLGFSHQNTKNNLVARWLLAMPDSTQKQVYRDRAEKWLRTMKSRLNLKGDGTCQIWNYWEPGGLGPQSERPT